MQFGETVAVHRYFEESIERLSARVLEQEHGPALVLSEGERSNGPCWIEILLQREFVLYLSEASGAGCSIMANRARVEERLSPVWLWGRPGRG